LYPKSPATEVGYIVIFEGNAAASTFSIDNSSNAHFVVVALRLASLLSYGTSAAV